MLTSTLFPWLPFSLSFLLLFAPSFFRTPLYTNTFVTVTTVLGWTKLEWSFFDLCALLPSKLSHLHVSCFFLLSTHMLDNIIILDRLGMIKAQRKNNSAPTQLGTVSSPAAFNAIFKLHHRRWREKKKTSS